MYCEECKKRPANVHVTKIANGNKVEKHLCEQCAKKQHEAIGFTLVPDFSFSNFLGSMLESDMFSPVESVVEKNRKCDKCGMTFAQFSKSGRMGCDKCYDYYGNNLEYLIKRIHGNTQHTGKIPKRTGMDIQLKQDLTRTKFELQKAVLNEEFEKAAELRDKIRELEKKMK